MRSHALSARATRRQRAGVRLGPLLALLALAVPSRADDEPPAAATAQARAFFETKIRPVLVEHCGACHAAGAERIRGGLRVDSRDGLRQGGDSGPAVVPGQPEASPILNALAHDGTVPRMPPRTKLPDAVVADFRRWITDGAFDPRDTATPAASPPASGPWWSLQPLLAPPVPALHADAAAHNPIDAFLQSRLDAAGLAPHPEADRRTLIRRVTFDLTGLPPSPEEVGAFEADDRPDAYERLVDRLLASPHHGERWARHWMDAVHFAETHGHDQDRIREHAWRYRDYLTARFNTDTPYGRFIAEQVAADALDPDHPELTPALGFLAAGPWDESSLRDIREDSLDRQIGRYLDRDDVVTTVLSTVTSTTVHCARCHDHKFDPITQADYYALQAVFAGIDRGNRPYDPDPTVAAQRAELDRLQAQLDARDPALLLSPATQAEVLAWEARQSARPADWTVLDAPTIASEHGTTFEPQPDGSILATGPRPDAETYTIHARAQTPGVTAIRLEVIPDDRLPSRGPGRNANGNLHLTEFEVSAIDSQGSEHRVPVRLATADFNQDGWGIAAAIDGNPQTAWGIHPREGQPHQAVFELAEDVGGPGVTLRIVLKQTYPVQHPIGRFRLALTTAPRPVTASALPDELVAALRSPAIERSDAQRLAVATQVMTEVLARRRADLPSPQFVYCGSSRFEPDGSHRPAPAPREVRVLRRGEIGLPGDVASPGALACLPELPSRFELPPDAPESARRAALARWLTDPRNVLTWRSIVNRVWHHHFGRGLVDTPNDFGRMGSPPSHPELLDWLAVTFRDEQGGSLKALHRRIVTSAAYRRRSDPHPAAAALDADNRLLARQNRRRLDAESLRDALLLASGRLDRALGGPSVRQFELRPGVHVTPVVDYNAYDWRGPGSGRRSVYRFLFRTLPDPMLSAFDAADASQLTASRTESITPLQALALRHNRFVLVQAEALAARVASEAGAPVDRLDRLFVLVLNRPPTADERADWLAYADRHGLEHTARMLFNTSEFLFLD